MTSTASGNSGGQSSAQQSSAQTASSQVGAQQSQAPPQLPQPPVPQPPGASQQVGAQQAKTHVSKTHCDSTCIAEIALLNKGGKRLENALIRTRNEMKAMTHLRRATEPVYAQQCPDLSDDESVITTSSSGTVAGQLLAKSLELLRAASPKALTALASVVHKVSDTFKTTTTAPTLSDSDSLRFASILEVSVESGMVLAPLIPGPSHLRGLGFFACAQPFLLSLTLHTCAASSLGSLLPVLHLMFFENCFFRLISVPQYCSFHLIRYLHLQVTDS